VPLSSLPSVSATVTPENPSRTVVPPRLNVNTDAEFPGVLATGIRPPMPGSLRGDGSDPTGSFWAARSGPRMSISGRPAPVGRAIWPPESPNLSLRIADVHGRQWSTHRSRRRFSRRANGLPRNLTFADDAEKVTRSDSGHSQVATRTWTRCRLNDCIRRPRTHTVDPQEPVAVLSASDRSTLEPDLRRSPRTDQR
jgi:hypothetical protein